jgi:hypothetical protein
MSHAVPSLPQPQKRVLHDLLGLLSVPRHQAHGPEDSRAVLLKEGLEAPGVCHRTLRSLPG